MKFRVKFKKNYQNHREAISNGMIQMAKNGGTKLVDLIYHRRVHQILLTGLKGINSLVKYVQNNMNVTCYSSSYY